MGARRNRIDPEAGVVTGSSVVAVTVIAIAAVKD